MTSAGNGLLDEIHIKNFHAIYLRTRKLGRNCCSLRFYVDMYDGVFDFVWAVKASVKLRDKRPNQVNLND